MRALENWSTRAVNLPEHADNPIHTDAGARAKGFGAALVAGVTVYAYLSHVPATAWGLDWLRRGGARVRFRSPVVDGDLVECLVNDGPDGESAVVEAQVGGECRALCEVLATAPTLPARAGESLAPLSVRLGPEWDTYGSRAGDDCPLYSADGVVHPAVWLSIANRFFHEQLVTGPWIHVRSTVAHHGLARSGAAIDAEATVIDRFDSRAGRRAVADVIIRSDGELVATLEHEAIVELA